MRKLRMQISASLLAFVMGTTTVGFGLENDVYGETVSTTNSISSMEHSTVQRDITITEDNFPDPIFRQWLRLSSSINGYGVDGILTPDEINQIKEINVSDKSISSLKGIELFEALETLSAKNNLLKELDVKNNKNLKYLNCDMNKISVLDVSGLMYLKALYCEGNTMKSLNLNGCISLETLYCRSNHLTEIDFSTNSNLIFIETFDNQLTSVDLSNLKNLVFVHLDHNRMTYVDLSHNTNLTPIGSGFVVRNNWLQAFKVPITSNLYVDPDVYAEQDPKTGYEKVQWYEDQEFTKPIEGKILAQGQTFYAKWIPNKYTVHFDGNGGSGIMSSQNVEWDQSFVLQENKFQRIGYVFDGWKSSRDSSTYINNEQVSNLAGGKFDGEKVTLSAMWNPITYTISFDSNGGTGQDMLSQSATYNQGVILPICSYQPPTDKKFAGWSTAKDGRIQFLDGSSVQNLTSEDGKTIVLYAIWKEDVSNNGLQQLETIFKAYKPSDYTTTDYETIRKIYTTAEMKLSNSTFTELEISDILQKVQTELEKVPTLTNRIDTLITKWKTDYQDVRNTMNAHKVNEANAMEIYEQANVALSSIGVEYVKQQMPELDNIADIEQITMLVKEQEQLRETLKSIEDLINAVTWVQTLNGLSVYPLSKVTSDYYGKYKEMCASSEAYDINLSVEMKDGLVYRRELAFEKQTMISELMKLYNGYDLTQYTEENQRVLKELLDTGIVDIENGDSIDYLETVLIKNEAEFKKVPIKENEVENNPENGEVTGDSTTGSVENSEGNTLPENIENTGDNTTGNSGSTNNSSENNNTTGNSSSMDNNIIGNGGSTNSIPIVVPPVIVPPIIENTKEEKMESVEEKPKIPVKENDISKKQNADLIKPMKQLKEKEDYKTKVVTEKGKVKVYFVFTGNYLGKSTITFEPTKLVQKTVTLKAGTDYTMQINEYKDKVQVKIILKGKYKGTFIQEYKKIIVRTKNKKTTKIKLVKIVKSNKTKDKK